MAKVQVGNVPLTIAHGMIEGTISCTKSAGEPTIGGSLLPAEVSVRSRPRTALDSLLEPLANSFRQTFRDH
jgi:hypothetical protein